MTSIDLLLACQTSLGNLNTNAHNSVTLKSKNCYPVDELLEYNMFNDTFLVKWTDKSTPTWIKRKDINEQLIIDYNIKRLCQQHNDQLNDSTGQLNGQWGYLYTRISSSPSSGSVSIDMQRSSMMAYCKENNIKIGWIGHDIHKSAKNMTSLDGLWNILDKIKHSTHSTQLNHSSQRLIIWDVSRFSRNVKQGLEILDELVKMKVTVFFLTENVCYNNSSGRHLIRTQLSQAQFLSEQVSEKVKSAIHYKRLLGHHIGGIPYGYKRINGKLHKSYNEQKIIKEIKTLFDKSYSVPEILNKMKNRYIRHRLITKSTIKTFLFH